VQVQQELPPAPPADVRRYVGLLWRRKWWILVPVVVAGLATFFLSSMREDRFRATGALLVTQPADTGVPFLDRALSDEAKRTIENEIEVIGSRDTEEAVRAAVGRPLVVRASSSGTNDVITLTAENSDPVRAAADVNDFADAYLDLRREARLEDLHAVRRQVVGERDAVQRNLTQLQAPLREIERLIAITPAGPERDALYNERDAIRDDNSYQRSSLNQQLSELRSALDAIDGAVDLTSGGITIITEAPVPSERYTPQPKKDTLVAVTIALLAGLALALVVEFAFDRISTQEDIELALPHDRFLGAIPIIEELADDGHSLLTFGGAQSLGTEAYRALAASIEFARLEKPVTVIHFTSPVSGEGKSTTAANLAAAFAETGAHVAIVDADVRRPELYRILGADNQVGLSTVLLGQVALHDALQEVEALPGVKLLSPGPLPQNPTKMLYARRTEEVFDALRAEFDVVLVDGPPVLPVADALILTQFTDMTILVLRSGTTRRRAVRRARAALARVEAIGLAIVLNAAPLAGPDGYGYYGQYYGSKEPVDGSTARRRRA
jgi:capsular exopolysaccharide synthesis family protein